MVGEVHFWAQKPKQRKEKAQVIGANRTTWWMGTDGREVRERDPPKWKRISEFVNFIPPGEVFNGNKDLFLLSWTNSCPNHVRTPIQRIRNSSTCIPKKPKGSRRTQHTGSEELSITDPWEEKRKRPLEHHAERQLCQGSHDINIWG